VDVLSRISVLGVIKIASPFVAWAGFQIRQRYKKSRAVAWRPTEGIVHTARAEFADQIWTLTVAYSYSWEGEYHSGFYKRQFASEKAADEAAEKFPKDSTLMVRVDADHPQTSAVLESDQFITI
jgi:hypothetical protein